MRVLVVDDHEVVRRGVRSLLSQSSYDVCGEAADGNDAVEKARQLKPDVIVMDVSMPTLNGLEATRLIRQEVPGSEVLIMSQHDSPAMIREAFKAGARGYVLHRLHVLKRSQKRLVASSASLCVKVTPGRWDVLGP